MEKTRKPITGENSHSNNQPENSPTLTAGKNSSSSKNSYNNTNRKKLPHQYVMLIYILRSICAWVHNNFVGIMCFGTAYCWMYVFIHTGVEGRACLLVMAACILAAVFRKWNDRLDHSSSLEKLRNFKRFTHRLDNGTVTIKQAEIEQIILYLYDVEEYLGKPRG